MAVEQPLGLALEIMRLRAFATAWQDSKRPRKDDEEVPTGGMQEWVRRVQHRMDEDVLADVRRMMGTG